MNRVWVRDPRWRLLPLGARRRKCRMRRCPNDAVAEFERPDGWWAYCVDHLYGRRIVDNEILVDVAAGSPMAQERQK